MTVAVAQQMETSRTDEIEWTVDGVWSAVESGRAQAMAGPRTLGGHFRAAPEATPMGIAWVLQLSDDAQSERPARGHAGPSNDRIPAPALDSLMRQRSEIRYPSCPERQIVEKDYRGLIAEIEESLRSRYGTMRGLQVFLRAAICHEEPRLDRARAPWWDTLRRGMRSATA